MSDHSITSLIEKMERAVTVKADLISALDSCSAALQRLHTDIQALVADSEGVTGLHQNGEVAPWPELMEGGQYSDWLGEPLWSARNAWQDARNAILRAQSEARV